MLLKTFVNGSLLFAQELGLVLASQDMFASFMTFPLTHYLPCGKPSQKNYSCKGWADNIFKSVDKQWDATQICLSVKPGKPILLSVYSVPSFIAGVTFKK